MHEQPFNLLGISPKDWAKTPEAVRLALLSLLDMVQAQSAQIKELQSRVRELEAKLGQTSRNSSKPPSSDPPSAPPKPPRLSRGRKAGGQSGHEGHQRPLAPPERVDHPVELLPKQCPHCQTIFPADLPTLGQPRRTQVWELPEIRPQITEYRQHSCCCPGCQQLVIAELPTDAPPGSFGPRATALMALLRGEYRLSLDDTADFLAQVCQLPVSSGCIVSSCGRASAALSAVDAAIHSAVQASAHLNVDETSWPFPPTQGWLWTAVATKASCYRIHTSRGKEGLTTLLGDGYRGIVTSDRLATYQQLPNQQRQLCWAHLLRNVVGLEDLYGSESGWAQQVLTIIGDLFLAWRVYKQGWFDQVALQQALIQVRQALRDRLSEGTSSRHPKIASFSRELLKGWEALWTFSRVEGIEPTNNAAERALRHAVLWRKGSFGSRSAAGCRFVERMLSVRATCAQQGRAFYGFVTEAIRAAWASQPAPILVGALLNI